MLINHFEQDKMDFSEYFKKEISSNSNSDFSTSENHRLSFDNNNLNLNLTVEEPSELLEYIDREEEKNFAKLFNEKNINEKNNGIELNLIDNIEKINDNEYNKKIFEIKKVPRNNSIYLIKKRINKTFKNNKKRQQRIHYIISEEIPKQKHFHFDKKKQRIVYQRNHLKVIYSIIGLSPPYDFRKYFKMIEEQIGERTNKDFNNKKKSFHIIRVNGEEKIVTLTEKKINLQKNFE